jgi:hypothetical protein
MNQHKLAMASLIVGVVACAVVLAQSKKLQRAELPPAVRTTGSHAGAVH